MSADLLLPETAAPAAELWRRRGRLMLHGGVLAVLGATSVLLAVASPFYTAAVLGKLLLMAGVVESAHGLRFWRSGWAGSVPVLVTGMLDLACGALLTAGGPAPVAGITLLVAAVLLASGALWLLWPLRAAIPGRRVAAVHGVATLLLALGLCAVWPEYAVSPIGLFVGGNLLASGAMLVFLACTVRQFAPRGT